jgi:hypothetical protein
MSWRSSFRDVPAALALAALCCAPGIAVGQPFPVLNGDPVDMSTGRAHPILPGVPLLLPQNDGEYDPPIVVGGTIGDVDLVLRLGTPAVTMTMPEPSAVPPVAIAGGTHVVDTSEVPFSVIVSDGSSGLGAPLLSAEMDGLPVVVWAWADLDGDGFVGPTAADSDGMLDDVRERQESDFDVGRTAAIFTNGIATGSIAIWRGAPASTGAMRVVLTAAAYVGPFVPSFMGGNVPDGPPIATMLPFFPRVDPVRVVESAGLGGPAGPEVRLGLDLAPAFEPPVNDATLGTPFAIPTDGSSGTVAVVQIISGTFSRARFVRASVAAGFPASETRILLLPSAVGTLWEPLTQIALADDGTGNGTVARLVPVDLFDNVTDPPPSTSVTLVAGPGVRIASPDLDANPSTETIPLTAAAGVDVTIDDAGVAGDGPATSRITVLLGGLPVDELAVTLTGGGTTTTLTGASTTSTTIAPGGGVAPVIGATGLTGPGSISAGCAARRTLWAVVTDPDADLASTSASVVVDGGAPVAVTLAPGSASDPDVPVGARTAVLDLPAASEGTAVVTLAAADTAGHAAAPVMLSVPIAPKNAPFAGTPSVAPNPIPAGVRTTLTMRAHAIDDCGLKRVIMEVNRGRGFRKLAKLRDDGRKGDAVAGDGVYGLTKRVKWSAGAVTFRTTVKSKKKLQTTSATSTIQVAP